MSSGYGIWVSDWLFTPNLHSAFTRTYVKLCDETAKTANGWVRYQLPKLLRPRCWLTNGS